MSDTITYTVDSETITFSYPMLTVTQTPIIAGRGDFTTSVRKIYAIRGIVFAEPGVTDLDEAISWMHQILSAPGGALVINYTDWDTDLNISPSTYADLKGGPHPRIVDITKIYGGKSAMVHWEIEVELFPTPAGYTGEIASWVDFIYTIDTTIDKDFFAVRTMSGLLRMNKNYTSQKKFSADSFRETISSFFQVPPASRGFWQRTAQVFKTNANDTIIQFTISDRQVYSWLPQYMTSGDLKVTTTSERTEEEGVVGSLTLSGFFRSTDYATRQLVHGAVIEVLNMFANKVLFTIQSETIAGTTKRFWIREKRHTYIHHWRSNQVNFDLHWEIKGQFDGGLRPNVEYTAGVVLQWLSELTNVKGSVPVNEGAYGTAKAAGKDGVDIIASPITLDFDAKMEASRSPAYWDIPTQGSRKTPSQGSLYPNRGQSTSSADNISFHQRITYKLDSGIRHQELLASGYDSILQQVHNPRMFMLIVGSAERWDAPPLVPPPPYTMLDNDAVAGGAVSGTPQLSLISAEIKPKETTGDGKYRLEWTYILLVHGLTIPNNLSTTNLTLAWPWTPNFTKAFPGEIFTFGTGV